MDWIGLDWIGLGQDFQGTLWIGLGDGMTVTLHNRNQSWTWIGSIHGLDDCDPGNHCSTVDAVSFKL